MNVADFLKSLLTRPLACAVIVGLALVAGIGGVLTAPRVYQSTAAVVVIPPGSGNPDAMLNPLINLSNNIAQLAAVVATVMRTDGASVATGAGGNGEFTVNTTFGDSPTFAQLTPQLVIEAKATSAEAAEQATKALADFASTTLTKIQADSWVPSRNNAMIVSSVAPQPGAEVSNSPIRSGAAYAFATVLAGVLLLIAYDGLLARRRRTAPGSQDSDDDEHAIEESTTWAGDDATVFTPPQSRSHTVEQPQSAR